MKNVSISSQSNKPIYQQLFEQLSIQILTKELKSGTLLPSIRVTARELRVSIITVKKAWEQLETNGYINTVAGKGSYVAETSDKNLQKKKIALLEESITEIIDQSKKLNLSKEELEELIGKLY